MPALPEILARTKTTPPEVVTLADIFGRAPKYKWPVADEALKVIQKAGLFSSQDYIEVGRAAMQGAFAITGELTDETLSDMRQLLAENMKGGLDREAFMDEAVGLLEEGSGLAESRLWQVFRNNTNTRYSEAKENALQNQMVVDAFPFREYFATTDQRVRDEHKALESLGLDGTGIYWATDPVWQLFRPPWDYGCRCTFSPVTVEQAARKGVRQAQEWLQAAKELAAEQGGEAVDYLPRTRPQPEYVASPPFEPSESWNRQGVPFSDWQPYSGPRGGKGWRNTESG